MAEDRTGRGFVAMPRELLDVTGPGAWFPGDMRTATLFANLVTRANWCDGTDPLPHEGEALKAGQVLATERDLAELFGVTRKAIQCALGRLETQGFIVRNKATGGRFGQAAKAPSEAPSRAPSGTLITICNYATIFAGPVAKAPSEAPSRAPLKTTSNKKTGIRETSSLSTPLAGGTDGAAGQIELLPPEPPAGKYGPDDLEVGRAWLQHALAVMPWAKAASWTDAGFAAQVAKVRRATGITAEGMGHVLAFVRADPFWVDKAVSPASLLNKSQRNGQRKIDNILTKLRGAGTALAGLAKEDALMRWANEQDAKEGGGYGDQE